MTFKTKRRIRIIVSDSIRWALAFIFLVIVRGVGTTENGSIDFDFKTGAYISLTLGLIFGFFSGIVQVISEERLYKQIPFYQLIIFRTFYFVLFLSGIIIVAYWINLTFLNVKIGLSEFAFDEGSMPVYFYILTVAVIFSTFSQLKLMIGEQQFNRMMRGKFYRPREEERIFMFLDLKSSTSIAERMGHIDYSMLIQDCFNDVSVVLENEAEIYQYVGDEIVLTWEREKGLKDQNCIKAYFNYKDRLKEREYHYRSNYGLLPEFKAGMNIGTVTVTEVGKYKKEIAYHGDPINTSARIQGLCNSLNVELLISEQLKVALEGNDFTLSSKGILELKGKEERVNVYEVGLN